MTRDVSRGGSLLSLLAACAVLAFWHSPAVSAEPQQVVEMQGFRFELGNCQLVAKKVKCALTVTSADQDRELVLVTGASTRIFDDAGNEYPSTRVEIANKHAVRGALRSLFIAGVPTRLGVHFDNVSTQARAISLLDVDCYGFKVQFRDVPLGG